MHRPFLTLLLGLLVTTAAIDAHANTSDATTAGAGERVVAETTVTPAPIPIGAGSTGGAAAYMPDHVLVRLKDASASRAQMKSGTTARSAVLGISSLDAIASRVGAVSAVRAIETPRNSSAASELGLDRWVLIELAPGSDVQAAVAAYAADPNVEVAEPDYVFQPLVAPNDPLYVANWGHNNTGKFRSARPGGAHTGPFVGTVGFDANAEAGWTGPHGFGDPSVIIAILDTGVDLTHPDLTIVDGYDTGDNDSNPQDDSATPGHGTACAGVAAAKANNGMGSCGSAPGCSIMPMKVANSFGFFAFLFIADAIVWATDHGADVISMSFGFYPVPVEGSALINAAIEYANAAGVVMFSGTGNANNGLMLYPASHPKVISVGAASPCAGRKRSSSNPAFLSPGVSPDPNNVSCDGVRWWGSSFGLNTPDAPDAVDILGPTLLPLTDIQGPGGYAPGDYTEFFNGVSCSVPYVAGVAALIKSKHPDWTPAQIRQQLLSTAQDIVNVESGPGWDRYSGYGMVDIDAAAGCGAAPVIVGNGGKTVGSTGNCCAMIRPADLTTSVSDPDGDEDIVSVRITKVDDTEVDADSTLVCGAGTHSVRVTARDYCDNTSSVWVDVHVTDTAPPSIAVVLDHDALWPPDHQMVPVCASITATDNCDAEPDVALVSVVSNEPDDGDGPDDASLDIGGADFATDDRCIDLRAERMGGGVGRWYTLVYSATDASNNVAYDTVQVQVPHDQSPAAMHSVQMAAATTGARITGLTSIHPNPFRPQTTVHFTLPNPEHVRLSIYDVKGARVRQLVDETLPSGPHQARWDGKSDRGARAMAGVYFVRMTAGSYSAIREIVKLE